MVLKAQGVTDVPSNTLAITYDNATPDHVYVSSYDKIFTHPDPTNCPVTSCTLRSSDCSAALAVNTELFMTSGNANYGVSAKQNIDAGWTDIDFCYKCSGTKFAGGSYEFTSAGLKVRQIRNCDTHVQATVSQPGTQTLLYDATTTTQTINLSSIYTIYGESDCGLTTCSLMNNGCGTSYVTTNTQITTTGDVPSNNQKIIIRRNIDAGFGALYICVRCTSVVQAGKPQTKNTQINFNSWSIRQLRNCQTSVVQLATGTFPLTTPTLALNGGCQNVNSAPIQYENKGIQTHANCNLYCQARSWCVMFEINQGNSNCMLFATGCVVDPRPQYWKIYNSYGDIQKSVLKTYQSSTIAVTHQNTVATSTGYSQFYKAFLPDTSTCVLNGCYVKNQGCGSLLSGGSITGALSDPWAITSQRGFVNGYESNWCYGCEVTNSVSSVKYYINTDNLYIKQIRDCTIHIQSIPSYGNSNQPLDKTQRISFDNTSPTFDIKIEKIINIIDDDDCGTDGGLSPSVNPTQVVGNPTTKCWFSQNGCQTYSASQFVGQLNKKVAQMEMTGTSGVFPVDFVLKFDQNIEDGWGPYHICVTCDSNKQTTAVNYDMILVQQVRNCATSLVIEPTEGVSPWNGIGWNQLKQNQTLWYSEQNQTITSEYLNNGGGYLNIFRDIESVYCPVLQCNLYEVGCQNPLGESSLYYLHMRSVKPWNLTVNSMVEDGVTINYCFKCYGDTSIVHPEASYDNLQIRMVRNCKTHIQHVTSPLTGYVAPIRYITNYKEFKMSSFFKFIDESDCGQVTCGLYDNDCTTPFTQRNVTMSTAWPDFTITAEHQVYLGYNYTTCIKCSSISQTLTWSNFTLNVRGYGWQGQLESADNVLADQYLRKNDTLNAINDWQTIGDWTSFFQVKDFKTFPILNCSLFDQGCVNPYLKGNIVMETANPWSISARADGDASSNYNDNVCVYCTNVYESRTYDKFGVGTIDCSSTLFESIDADKNSIQTEYERGKVQNLIGQDFFENDKEDECPIKSCSLQEQGCVNSLDSENVVISGDSGKIIVKLSNPAGYDLSACVKCTNGQQIITYDNWSISQSSINYKEVIYLKTKANQVINYDLNGNITTVSSSIYYTNKEPYNYPLSSFTLYEQGCFKPILPDANKFLWMDGITTLKMRQDVSEGYKLRVCVKMEFSQRSSPGSTDSDTSSSSQDKVVYTLSQDNILFQQIQQPPLTVTKIQIEEKLIEKEENKTKEEEKVVDCSKYISVQQGLVPSNVYFDYSPQQTKIYKISSFFKTTYPTKCNFDQCFIRQTDCATQFAGDYIRFEDQTQKIFVQYDIKKGYNDQICVYCQVDKNTSITFNNWSIVQYNEPTPEDPIVTADVTSISATGEVKILFNTDMNTDIDLNKLRSDYFPFRTKSGRVLTEEETSKENQNFIDIKVQPHDDWDKTQGIDQNRLTWKSWKATAYVDNYLKLLIDFNDPKALSPFKKEDKLKIDMQNGVDAGLFKSKNSGKLLNLKSFKQTKNIRQQMEASKTNKTFEWITQNSKQIGLIMIVMSFLLSFFISASLSQVIQWINSIQLVIHLPMLSMIVPPCVLTFFTAWMNISTFDILNNDYFAVDDVFFEFDFKKQSEIVKAKIPDQTQDLGYDNTNALIILGSLGLCVLAYLFFFLFYFGVMIPLQWWKPKSAFIQRQGRNLKQNLFFGQLITLVITGYMEFLIAGYYSLTNQLGTTNGEVIGSFVSYVVLFLTCVFLPLTIIYILVQRRRDLHRHRIFNVFGEIYAGFKTDERLNLTYYLLFGVRRIIYIYVVFNWDHISWAQAMALMFMNLFMVIYIGQQKPMSRLHKNRIELFNEVCIAIITIHMICYTDWVPGRQERDIMGWSMIFIIALNIVLNTKSIYKVIFHSSKLIFTRYKNQVKGYLKHQLNKKFLPYLMKRDEMDSNSGTMVDPHGNFSKTGAKLTHFRIPFDPLKRLPKPDVKKLSVIPEESQDYSDRDGAKKPRRYYSLINVDYDLIPKKYGEDQLNLPQMVIVLEMIKNGELIIETLNPEDEDFLEKFYEQRNQVEIKNMKDLSIQDTIFVGGLHKENDHAQDDGEPTDDGSSNARRSDAFLINSNSSSPEKSSKSTARKLLRQVAQLSYTGETPVSKKNKKFSQIAVDIAPRDDPKKAKGKKSGDAFADILNKHVKKYGLN